MHSYFKGDLFINLFANSISKAQPISNKLLALEYDSLH